MSDLVSRRAAVDIVRFECGEWEGLAKTIIKRFEQLPSVQPDVPDKEKISDALYHIYRNKGTSTAAEGVAAIRYYIAEIWREIYGEEGPRWMKK